MNQDERLNYLVENFREENAQYRDVPIPADPEGKRQILRSLMNIRMPKVLPPSVLTAQDEYLQERIRENGVVQIADIPTIRECGSTHPCGDRISIWQGDITRLAADAIVNAANAQMLGCFIPMHTCIDNQIHTLAGVQLRAECARQMRELRVEHGMEYEQPTGVPMLTDGYNLPAKKIIHVVGPMVFEKLTEKEEDELALCYRNVLDLCLENNLKTVVFCCLSTGVFRFPGQRASEIAVETVTDWLKEHPGTIERVVFNVFRDEDKEYYEQRLLQTA